MRTANPTRCADIVDSCTTQKCTHRQAAARIAHLGNRANSGREVIVPIPARLLPPPTRAAPVSRRPAGRMPVAPILDRPVLGSRPDHHVRHAGRDELVTAGAPIRLGRRGPGHAAYQPLAVRAVLGAGVRRRPQRNVRCRPRSPPRSPHRLPQRAGWPRDPGSLQQPDRPDADAPGLPELTGQRSRLPASMILSGILPPASAGASCPPPQISAGSDHLLQPQ